MRFRTLAQPLVAFVFVCLGSGAASSAPITGLFNTGVDGSGAALSGGAVDTHYNSLSPALPAVVVTTIPGSWVDNTATHRWVWMSANGQPTNVTRTFRTTFDLTGLNAATASISGQWAVDNTGLDILINGVSTGNTCGGFTALCNFTVASGFVAGLNTLDFVAQDVGSIAGFLVSSISGTAEELVAGVPLPASLALLGFGVFALARRSRVR